LDVLYLLEIIFFLQRNDIALSCYVPPVRHQRLLLIRRAGDFPRPAYPTGWTAGCTATAWNH
jgi:hypothetical protein